MTETDDAALLLAWRAGDTTAANKLVERNFPSLYRFVRPRAGPQAAELIQRTFLAAVESKDRVPEGVPFRAYLLGIARNILLMHHRSSFRRARVISDDPISGVGNLPTPTGAVAMREQQRLLVRALRRLPLDMQLTVELFYWEELPREQIAQVLGIAPTTVKSRLQRAREKLREIVQELDPVTGAVTAAQLERWASSLRNRYDLEEVE